MVLLPWPRLRLQVLLLSPSFFLLLSFSAIQDSFTLAFPSLFRTTFLFMCSPKLFSVYLWSSSVECIAAERFLCPPWGSSFSHPSQSFLPWLDPLPGSWLSLLLWGPVSWSPGYPRIYWVVQVISYWVVVQFDFEPMGSPTSASQVLGFCKNAWLAWLFFFYVVYLSANRNSLLVHCLSRHFSGFWFLLDTVLLIWWW